MRKANKEQAIDFLKTLSCAHDELKILMEQQRSMVAFDTALCILEDCQQGAIKLGNMIEASEGEGVPVISLLEDYCELIYQIYEQLKSKESVNVNKNYKNLRRLQFQIENSIKNNIKESLEVVFLPYKASMWDSLESIWKAANLDEACDVYVVPIPYYDKDLDGNFRRMRYEGQQYPAYVPITWYEDYDFANRHPDFIFIHNPYDNSNYVTSVHPFFYSDHLKQYTDNLVYVPYFILDEIHPEDQTAIQGMCHFVTTPGVVNADKVIVQSEAMRQIYINVLTEYTNNHEIGRLYWGERILGLGSPKMDKVRNTKKEELDIPKKWMKVLKKPDGSMKKIVFYNTSVGALLEHNEKMLVKMRDVFRVFKENQDEVALLWRPHPLIESTLTSMRPQLWDAYKELRDWYIAAGWGIYDNTPDMERAIVLCDSYYGDNSSVVPLCKKAGVQILMQNVNIVEKECEKIPFAVSRGGLIGENFWCISHFFDGLWKYNLESCELNYVMELPNFNDADRDAYSEILTYKEYLILVPAFSDDLLIYHTGTESVRKICLQTMRFNKNLWIWAGGFVYNHYLILYPAASRRICRVDLKSYEYSFVDMEHYVLDWNVQNVLFHYDSGCEVGGRIYIPFARQDRVMILDIDRLEVSCLNIESRGSYFCCALVQKDKLILAPEYNGAYVIYNLTTNRSKVVGNVPSDYIRKEHRSVLAMYPLKEEILVIHYCGNMFLKLNNEQLEKDQVWSEWIQEQSERSRWASNEMFVEKIIPCKDKMLLISGRFNELAVWDQKTNYIKNYRLEVDEAYKRAKYGNRQSDFAFENYIFSLRDAVKYIYGSRKIEDAGGAIKDIGGTIYRSIVLEA